MNTYCTSIDNIFTNIHILIISSKTGQSWQSKVWPFGPPPRKHKPHKRTTICCSKGVQTLNGPEQSHTHEHKIYAPNHLKHQMVQNRHKIHDRKLAGPKYYKQPNAVEHSEVSHPCAVDGWVPENEWSNSHMFTPTILCTSKFENICQKEM